MLEARGNLLHVPCEALVITTNGFVKANGEAVMGRGIAKQIATQYPEIPRILGNLLKEKGNHVHILAYTGTKYLVSFPVKPVIGSIAVSHMEGKFRAPNIPGWACKADLEIIYRSLHELVALTQHTGWKNVVLPRPGCGAGELNWDDVKPLCESVLDERFTAYTY